MWKTIKQMWNDYNSVQQEFSAMGFITFYSLSGAFTHVDCEMYQEWLKRNHDRSNTISEEN